VRTVDALTTLNAAFSPEVVFLALGFSFAVGLFFGIYPAGKAARLNAMAMVFAAHRVVPIYPAGKAARLNAMEALRAQ